MATGSRSTKGLPDIMENARARVVKDLAMFFLGGNEDWETATQSSSDEDEDEEGPKRKKEKKKRQNVYVVPPEATKSLTPFFRSAWDNDLNKLKRRNDNSEKAMKKVSALIASESPAESARARPLNRFPTQRSTNTLSPSRPRHVRSRRRTPITPQRP